MESASKTREMVESCVSDILREAGDLPNEPFGLDSNLYVDLGLDSLQSVAVAVEVERKFGVRIPEKTIPTLVTGNQLTEFILSNCEC